MVLCNMFFGGNQVKEINGGVTAPAGFRAGTAECRVKYKGRPDLVLIGTRPGQP